MTKARILADYVAGGTTAIEFDYLDGLTSAAVGINDTQTLSNKTFVAPALGTPASGVIGGAITFENGKTLRNIEEDYLTSNIHKGGTGAGGATTEFTVFTPTYTPKFSGSQVTGTFYAMIETDNDGGSDGRGYCKLEFTGSGITNWTASGSSNFGEFDRGGSGTQGRRNVVYFAPLHTTTSTDEITCTIKAKMSAGSGSPAILFYGGGSPYLYSKFQWMEFK